MGEFADEFEYCLKPSLPFMEMDPSLELMSHLEELNGPVMENPSMGMMGYCSDFYLPHHPEFSVQPFTDSSPGFLPIECQNPEFSVPQPIASSIAEQSHGDRKRKALATPDTSSGIYTEAGLAQVNTKKKNGSGGVKRGKSNSKEVEKPKEVIHVRARRGQATDSHSLAERERRKKINERMRRLQDQVPGCYKTMGMARMLDEIISYVQSLQNQVEFLSMELSAASYLYDFNNSGQGMGVAATAQVDDGAQQVHDAEIRRLVEEGSSSYGDCTTTTTAAAAAAAITTSFHSSSLPF